MAQGMTLGLCGSEEAMVRIAALAMPPLLLLACATTAAPSVEWVQIVTAGQKERQCKSLGDFTINQRGGPDKSGVAVAKALREVSHRGGNGMYVISDSVDWEDGASVNAEALRCQF
jgi:hypothetical protein